MPEAGERNEGQCSTHHSIPVRDWAAVAALFLSCSKLSAIPHTKKKKETIMFHIYSLDPLTSFAPGEQGRRTVLSKVLNKNPDYATATTGLTFSLPKKVQRNECKGKY